MNIQWKGVMPAITTQFTENDELDLELFKVNVQAQLDAGIHGLVLGGTLGEASTLSIDELRLLTRVTVEFVDGKVPVVMNIAAQTTKEAIELARIAEEDGASGIMILPPMRYSATDEEMVTYFKAVAKSTTLPIMIYNNPIDYKLFVTLDMFEALIDTCSNIQAVKESTRDTTNVIRIKNRFGDRLAVLCGVDTLAFESLCLGADGWVAGLVDAFPAETVAIYELTKVGRYQEALNIYRWFMPLLELDIHPKLVQYIKMASVYTKIGSEYVRAPRLVLEGEERARIISIIEEGLKTRPTLPEYKNLSALV
ncbi:dihydrodipicolinate synthase family protein [Seonamhaeicola sp.]|uniref:dihydrodipicolinate synthase family protein n=1 Tax=Seonamhaeicola sp. TaxID=1912245 RepID=UPI00260E82AB|nr:dihydrodipicolinate synthase family protein [Seonamhaeicola sp.]